MILKKTTNFREILGTIKYSRKYLPFTAAELKTRS